MIGISRTLTRLPAATAFLAGAALLATSTCGTAAAQPSDDTAFAVPRIDPRGASGLGLPQPLPPSDALRIRRIFELQARGDWEPASAGLRELDFSAAPARDMLGHLLAQRYLAASTRPSADELQAWLKQWPLLPDATAIHTLLLTRLPRGMMVPPPPVVPGLARGADSATSLAPVPEDTEPEAFTVARNPALDRAVHDAARNGMAGAVERLLSRTQGLTPSYASQLRGEAAQILFTLNRDAEALALGSAGMRDCARANCPAAALAGYVAGLAAWRLERPAAALPLFEAAWRAELTTASLRAASALWAGRAQLRIGHPQAYRPWLTRASAEVNTFHGMIARRILGLGFGFSAAARDLRETLSEADIEAVAATPEGMRAFALLQVGQNVRAEAELRRLWPAATSHPTLGRAIMLVAERAGLAQLAGQLAELVQAADGRPREATRFPIPRLQPEGGFMVDPAMVYGITRTESNFNTALVSNMGATGLMQIMPDTASFLTGQAANGSLRGSLRDPGINLALGQRYITYLAQHEQVHGDLLRLLASYNAGPGSFARWGGNIRHATDPLLFVEAVPINETRVFITRVLTNTWIYAARMHLPTPSLDELAAGLWPRYHPLTAPAPFAALH